MASPYSTFGSFVLRAPLLPVSFYQSLTAKDSISDEQWQEVLQNPTIREAIYLASSSLFAELSRWETGQLTDPKKVHRLQLSLLKYLSRMCSRSTPFGLLAGVAVGQWGDHDNITLKAPEHHHRVTRLDMNLVVALGQMLSQNPDLQKHLIYHPNSSLYRMGKEWRYIEYHYVAGRREHEAVAVTDTAYLRQVLEVSRQGASLPALIQSLLDDHIDEEMAQGYLQELINSQVLMSNLEPSVIGPDFTQQLIQVLQSLPEVHPTLATLEAMVKALEGLDQQIGQPISHYEEILTLAKSLEVEFEEKYLLQCDLELQADSIQLSHQYQKQALQAIQFLSRITNPWPHRHLKAFAERFERRYETREMPLAHVLDVETGLGYADQSGHGDHNPLVDDLELPEPVNPFSEAANARNETEALLWRKILEGTKDGVARLEEKDFAHLPQAWEGIPDTFAAMAKAVRIDGKPMLYLTGGVNATGASLVGRFAHLSNPLLAYTQDIVDWEQQNNPEALAAEIVHLPEARVGNVLKRPNLRPYQIPYLASPSVPEDQVIELEDLRIRMRHGKLLLRSAKHNRPIKPYLSNAHQFDDKSLPVYHFLCDYQHTGDKMGLLFPGNAIPAGTIFVPRITYQDIIFVPATWRLKQEHFQTLYPHKENANALLVATAAWQKQWNLPQYILQAVGDNHILVNLANALSVQMLLDSIRKLESITLREFFFNDESPVQGPGGHYANEVLLTFRKPKTTTHHG